MTAAVERARREAARPIVWIQQMLPKDLVIPLYTHASIFVCPSVYEPFGIINLEAMAWRRQSSLRRWGEFRKWSSTAKRACSSPPEAISAIDFETRHPDQFSRDFAAGVDPLLDETALRDRMARTGAGPRRAEVCPLLLVDQHRAADARVLRGVGWGPRRAEEKVGREGSRQR